MPSLYRNIYSSPLGNLLLEADEKAIIRLHFLKEEEPTHITTLSPLLRNCIQQLDEYFSGELKQFNLPLNQSGTPFQQRVWAALQDIGFGKTATYGQLSRKLGNSKAIRAVGAANGKNDMAIIVPCHRVIGADGSLVGYAGGLWRKKWLLDHEATYGNGQQTLF